MHFHRDLAEDKAKNEAINNLYVIKRLIPFFKKHKKSFILSLVFLPVITAFSISLPLLLKYIIDSVIPNKNFNELLFVAILYLSLFVTGKLLSYLQTIYISEIGLKITLDIKNNLFSHILHLALPFHQKNNPGKLLARIENDGENLRQLFSNISINIFSEFFTLLGILLILLLGELKLTIWIIGITIGLIIATFLFMKFIRKYFQQSKKLYAEITGFITEYVQGIPIIQIYNAENHVKKKLHNKNILRFKNDKKMFFLEYGYWSIVSYFEILVIAIIFVVGGKKIVTNAMTIGSFIMFIEYARMVFRPIVHASEYINAIQKSLVSANRIFNILDEVSLIDDPKSPKKIGIVKRGLSFDNVSFSYNKDESVFTNISFLVPQGKKIAIVGPTGAGKSTIVNLAMRFYDPLSGSIKIDGVDIKDVTQNDLRSKIGLVLQDNHLFYGTVLENISSLNEEILEKDAQNAARIVQADEFITKLPLGYYSELTDGGNNISFGERQLIFFARALVINPEILILDEATSSVDPYTENLIQRGLTKLLENRTALIIAHRLSTIKSADKIIVLKDGKIAEEGDHSSLYIANGLYREMYELQEFIK